MIDFYQMLGFVLALLVGVSLGVFGSGGSILSVPILVYIMKIEPLTATTYSLFIVGNTALVGSFYKIKENLIDFKKVFLFGLPTIISVFLTRKLILPNIPEIINFYSSFSIEKSVFLMLFFAVVMIFAALKMIKPSVETTYNYQKINYYKIIFSGVLIGLTAGFAGAGGGFLIIPALVFIANTPMKTAVGTSLAIVAIQSLTGFISSTSNQTIDWKLLLIFTICAIIGILIGNLIAKKTNADKLKTSFGWFVLLMGVFIFLKEVFRC